MVSHLSDWNIIPYLSSDKIKLLWSSWRIFLLPWVDILHPRITSSAMCLVLDWTYSWRSMMKARNQIECNTLPCGIHESTALSSEATPSMTTLWVQSCWKVCTQYFDLNFYNFSLKVQYLLSTHFCTITRFEIKI